jgi:hypothetical protein
MKSKLTGIFLLIWDCRYIKSRNLYFSRPPPEASEMQDGAHFTTTQLVRAGISYNYLKSRSVFVLTLYNKISDIFPAVNLNCPVEMILMRSVIQKVLFYILTAHHKMVTIHITYFAFRFTAFRPHSEFARLESFSQQTLEYSSERN